MSPETKAQDAVFIEVEVADEVRDDAELAAKLEEVCPVDIFADDGGRVRIVDENLDECILCGLCLDVGPAGAVRVVKLYDGDRLLEKDASA